MFQSYDSQIKICSNRLIGKIYPLDQINSQTYTHQKMYNIIQMERCTDLEQLEKKEKGRLHRAHCVYRVIQLYGFQ